MKRREFLVGAVATAVAATLSFPAMADTTLAEILKSVEKEDYNVRYSDLLWETYNASYPNPDITARARAMKSVLERHWEQSRLEGKNLHMYVDMRDMAVRITETKYYPATYIADKVSVIMPDKSYKLVKDRTKVIEHETA
jgi:hypothetical protein